MDINSFILDCVKDNVDFIIGFAKVENLVAAKYLKYKYAVSIGLKLDNKIIDTIKTGPDIEYYNHYKHINRELYNCISKISNELAQHKIENLPIKPTFEDDELDDSYFETLRTDFSHKLVATRAGLGWIGKSDLFISREFGPRLRLASILLRDEIDYCRTPIEKSECNTCNICVKKCPAGAISGKLWNTNIDRDIFYDAIKCRTKAIELSKNNMNKKISLCGICISVCPIGQKSTS